MRLVAKHTLLLMIAICAVLAIDGYLAVERELDLFNTDMRRDAHKFGQVLANTAAEVWATRGEARAKALLEGSSSGKPELRLRWISLDGPNATKRQGQVSQGELLALQPGRAMSIAVDDSDEGHLYTYVPVRAGLRTAAIEFTQPLTARNAYTKATVRRTILLVTLTVAVCAFFSLALGVWIVGRPVRALIARMRAIGRGDLTGKVEIRSRDELGTLGREIDTMSRQLMRAHDSLASEHADRLHAEAQLRHADRLATVGTLASGVAHEMGTPLNVVAERATMVEREQVSGPEVLDNARIIREQAQRMTAIIRQLLDFARRSPTPHATQNAVICVRESAALLETYAQKREVAIEMTAIPTKPAYVSVDVEQLRQALTNLIMNAVQASAPGSAIELGVQRTRKQHPDIRNGPERDWVCMSVRDHGAGIEPADVARVFEPFFTTKDVGEGTGLGLAVSYGIIKDHDGWIEVESRRAKGSRFSVFLPEVIP